MRARKDRENAERYLLSDPASAASNAQQCAEKSVKAAAFELCEFKEKEFVKISSDEWGHNSMLAIMAILKSRAQRALDQSNIRDVVTSGIKDPTKSVPALVTALIGQTFLESYTKTIEHLGKDPFAKDGGYWIKSLDPNIKPKLKPDDKWIEAAQPEVTKIETSMALTYGLLGLNPGDIPGLDSLGEKPIQGLERLRRTVSESGAVAKDEIIKGIDDGIKQLRRTFGPKLEMVDWLESVVPWLPLLDSHAIKGAGRYAVSKQAKMYETHVAGVRNLVSKAAMIYDKTVEMLGAFERRS